MKLSLLTVVAAWFLCLPAGWAQAVPPGHWQGSIDVPDHALVIEVDLTKNPKDEWSGTINIPEQQIKQFPLSDIAIKEDSVRFAAKGIPGDPKFDGRLAPSGTAISGEITQAGNQYTFLIRRTGDAVIPPRSPAVSKEMEGSWEGVLEVDRKTLKLSMANQEDGTVNGTLTGADQTQNEIPITTITQRGSKLTFAVKTIHATYEGSLVDGALVGEWLQGGGTFPLTFRRAQENKQ
jgi:hypothetical protein